MHCSGAIVAPKWRRGALLAVPYRYRGTLVALSWRGSAWQWHYRGVVTGSSYELVALRLFFKFLGLSPVLACGGRSWRADNEDIEFLEIEHCLVKSLRGKGKQCLPLPLSDFR